MRVSSIDHVVLTASDLQRTIRFYTEVLGMRHVVFESEYQALHFGDQKINLHDAARPWKPHASKPIAGTLDLCLLTNDRMDAVVARLAGHGIPIEEGPVHQTGAQGQMVSVYIRDPDNNLIEIATYAGAGGRVR